MVIELLFMDTVAQRHNKSICNGRADIEAIGSKSLIGFSSGLTLELNDNVMFNNKTKINFGTGVTEC